METPAVPADAAPLAPPAIPVLGAHANRKRWIAFAVLGTGTLMNVLDTTIANIALTPIQNDLGFSSQNLAWVVNAYLLTFGGFLLLGGRLGDLYGPRRLFLVGLVTFTVASLACGVAQTQTMLIVARAVQGIGAALVAAVSLSIVMGLFQDPAGRAKAMGIFAFIASGGGALGSLLGGYITAHFDWHWNFLINVPIGVAVYFATLATVPNTPGIAKGRIDIAGAITLTASLLLAVYAVVGAKDARWTSTTTLGLFAGSVALMAAFIAIEKRVANPLVPLTLFRSRNIVGANAIGILWAAGMFAWFFLSSLYMQNVLRFAPDRVGYAFLPANVIMAIFSVGLSARLVKRFGIRTPLVAGLLLATAGLALFARAPVDGTLWIDIVPGMALLGLGAGMAFNPLFLAAMSDAKPEESGLASGLVNTSFMMGGALGLAVLASYADSRTATAAAGAVPDALALNTGYHAAFALAATATTIAALLAAFLLRVARAPSGEPVAAVHA
ncbi:MAG: DHA2 family efflux MFS transporter permease subunit [Candidatus Thermoplasmatota archaeon]